MSKESKPADLWRQLHAAAETMPQATSHIDDLVGAVEEIRRLCAVADNDRGFINKAAVVEVLDRWCV